MRRACIRSAVPTASQSKPQLFRLRQPMTPVLPVGERKLRHVSVFLAAVRQAGAFHYQAMYRRRDQSTRVSEKFSSREMKAAPWFLRRPHHSYVCAEIGRFVL